ncbi:MAG: hypothetical protein R3E13_01490 [Alphaproteobacteria bacterium]
MSFKKSNLNKGITMGKHNRAENKRLKRERAALKASGTMNNAAQGSGSTAAAPGMASVEQVLSCIIPDEAVTDTGKLKNLLEIDAGLRQIGLDGDAVNSICDFIPRLVESMLQDRLLELVCNSGGAVMFNAHPHPEAPFGLALPRSNIEEGEQTTMYDQEFVTIIKESLREALKNTVKHNPQLFAIAQRKSAQNATAPGAFQS